MAGFQSVDRGSTPLRGVFDDPTNRFENRREVFRKGGQTHFSKQKISQTPSYGSRGLVAQARLITGPGQVRFLGLPLVEKASRGCQPPDSGFQFSVFSPPRRFSRKSHGRKNMTQRYKQTRDNLVSGLWCNWQHCGLLIRQVRVQLPSARFAGVRREA